jgi:thiol-disulfide isomerase/thioredoxin
MKNKLALFYLESCEPCKFQKPLIEKVAKEHKIPLEVIPGHTKEGREFSEGFGVKGFPQVLFIVDDVVKEVMMGYDTNSSEEVNKNRILSTLKELKFI